MKTTSVFVMSVIATAGLLSVSTVQADSADPLNGKRLFETSRCLECHSTSVFSRPDRTVKSLAALESQVRRCDASLSTNWFDDQILDVVAYLNKTYYKFPVTSARISTGGIDSHEKREE